MPEPNSDSQVEQLEKKISTLESEIQQLKEMVNTLSSAVAVLHTYERFDDEATQPPLDSSVIWMRGKKASTPPGYVHQILSLISEVNAETSYPWPLYVQLETSHNQGDADGVTVRLMKNGNGWGTAYHAETFHDGGSNSTIGVNIEAHRKTDAG